MADYINQKYLDKFTVDTEPPEMRFIGEQLLTEVPVKLAAGKVVKWDKFSSKQIDSKVGVRSPAKEFQVVRTKGTDGTYSTDLHYLKDLVTDREKEEYQDFTSLAEDTITGLKKLLRIEREIEVAALAHSNIAGTSGTYHFTPTVKWNATTGTIIVEKDIRTAIAAFKANALIKPNTLVLPETLWDEIVMDSTLRNTLTLVPGRPKQDIKLSSILNFLFDNFENIYIPNGLYDTAAKGQTESLTDIWGNHVVLLYVKKGKGTTRSFTWGGRYIKQNWQVTQIPEKDPEGMWYRVGYEDDIQEVCATARYVIKDARS